MKKRVVAMLLTTIMALSCLAGCGAKNETSSEQSKNTQQESSSTQKSEQSTVQEEEEIIPVTWVIRCDPQEDDEQVVEAMNEILREKYHLELNLISIPAGEYNEKPRLMITSGEEWDLMYTASFTNNFYENAAMGAYLPLNDLLESEVAADLMAVYPEGLYDVATIDGNIYALPNYQSMVQCMAFYVQKDLADKYGLDYSTGHVKDITELYDFMDQLLENEKDIWPINEKASFGVNVFENTRERETFYAVASVDADDPEMKVYWGRDEYELERLKKVNELYKKGYIREDVVTVMDNSGDVKANRYAITHNTGKPGGDVEYSTKQGEEYVMLYNDGYSVKLPMDAGATTMTAINVNSKNPEAALKLYSAMWTDKELYNMFLFGIEGEHYKKLGENRVELIENSGYNRSGYGWMLGNQFNSWLLPGQADTVWEETDEMNRNAEKSVLTGFVLNTEPIAAEIAQINAVLGEYNKAYYYDNLEEMYNECNDKLWAAGAQKVIDEVQKQIDEWRAENGK